MNVKTSLGPCGVHECADCLTENVLQACEGLKIWIKLNCWWFLLQPGLTSAMREVRH